MLRRPLLCVQYVLVTEAIIYSPAQARSGGSGSRGGLGSGATATYSGRDIPPHPRWELGAGNELINQAVDWVQGCAYSSQEVRSSSSTHPCSFFTAWLMQRQKLRCLRAHLSSGQTLIQQHGFLFLLLLFLSRHHNSWPPWAELGFQTRAPQHLVLQLNFSASLWCHWWELPVFTRTQPA